ncbi:MAG TPA: PAS domain-containing protein [Chloroflexia bacterium]|nr:PAS domain-containing protein [Chloroflexia bacterium]
MDEFDSNRLILVVSNTQLDPRNIISQNSKRYPEIGSFCAARLFKEAQKGWFIVAREEPYNFSQQDLEAFEELVKVAQAGFDRQSSLEESQRDFHRINRQLQLSTEIVNGISYEWEALTGQVTYSSEVTRLLNCDLAEVEPNVTWWLQRIHPLDLNSLQDAYNQMLFSDKNFEVKYRVRTNSGFYRHVHDKAKVERDSAGRAVQITGIIIDISQQKLAEEALTYSEEQLRYIHEAAGIGTWDYNVISGEIKLSDVMEQLHGLTPGHFEGTIEAYLKHIHEDDRHILIEAAQRVMDGATEYNIEVRLCWPDSSIHWAQGRGRAVRDMNGRVTNILGIALDISERKLAEHKIHLLNDQLEQRVSQRTLELEATNHELAVEISERKRTEEELREGAKRQAAVAYLGQRALEGLPLQTIIEEAVKLLTQTLGVEFSAIVEETSIESGVRILAGAGWQDGTIGTTLYKEESSLMALTCLQKGTPLIIEDWQNDTRVHWRGILRQHKVRSSICAIIYNQNHPFGVLAAHSKRPYAFNTDSIYFLQAISNVLAAAIQRKETEDALRSSEELYRTLAQNFPNGAVFLYNQELRLTLAEGLGLAVANLDRHSIEGRLINEILTAEMSRVITPQCVLALEGEATTVEVSLRDRSYEVSALPVRNQHGEIFAGMSVAQDITARKQMEKEIRTALETEKELNELKSRFISMTSHEFRTPLSTILTSAELLEHYGQRWEEERKKTHLKRIQTSVLHMTQMLNDVLTIGKAEAGKLECTLSPINLPDFCQNLVEELQMSLDSDQVIHFSASEQFASVSSDEKLLRQILGNLLSNALKYSRPDSEIFFELNFDESQAIFIIEDRGIGIYPDDFPQIFSPFHRGTNVGNISGTGLGLTIVKKSLDLLGGKISCESEPGKGTIFTVRLPFVL